MRKHQQIDVYIYQCEHGETFTAYLKQVTSKTGHFRPKGHNLFKLGSGLLDNATYQGCRLCGFRPEVFIKCLLCI